MWTENFRQLAHYNGWANERLYAHVERLDEGSRKASREMYGGSIDGLLHHLLISDGLTMATLTDDASGFRPRNRLGEAIQIESLIQCLYPVYSELWTARVHLDKQLVEFTATLTDAELNDMIAFFDFNGERHKMRRFQLLTELFSHQQHHRGQLTAVLHGIKRPLGTLDFTSFLQSTDAVTGMSEARDAGKVNNRGGALR
ncbi:MAG: DinB family protein [Polyangiaceae bacterium]